jgi:hypothetical protein
MSPLVANLRSRELPESLGATSGDCGDLVMARIYFSARNCYTIIDVCSVRYDGAENIVPVTCLTSSSELHSVTSAKLDLSNFGQVVQIQDAPNRRCQRIPEIC